MATVDEMLKLGYGPKQKSPSAIEQIGSLLGGYNDQTAKQDAKTQEDTMNQVKLYGALVEAGYSPEDATSKVNRTYRSTNFIEDMVNGKSNVFNQPAGQSKYALDKEKTKADIAKTKASTASEEADIPLKGAKTKYYNEGGPKRTVNDKMNPNQIQTRIKYLETMRGAMDTPEENQDVENEIKLLNERMRALSGFTGGASSETTAKGSVIMTGPDGKKYKIPSVNVEKAKKRGFK